MCKVVNQVNAELQRGLDKVDVSLGGLENDSPACPAGMANQEKSGRCSQSANEGRKTGGVLSRSYITSSQKHISHRA